MALSTKQRLDWDCIMPNGDPNDCVSYRPLEQFAALYLVFSEVRTAQQLLNFFNHYGPLTWIDWTTKLNSDSEMFRDEHLTNCESEPASRAVSRTCVGSVFFKDRVQVFLQDSHPCVLDFNLVGRNTPMLARFTVSAPFT